MVTSCSGNKLYTLYQRRQLEIFWLLIMRGHFWGAAHFMRPLCGIVAGVKNKFYMDGF